jgi:hypothetical protein
MIEARTKDPIQLNPNYSITFKLTNIPASAGSTFEYCPKLGGSGILLVILS